MPFQDLHQYAQQLEEQGKLVRVKTSINKDTELMPLVRWQFRGLPESKRKAFIFENVTDSEGRHYGFAVMVGALAGSREIYALGMGCKPDEIHHRWMAAVSNPILPLLVDHGPVQEEVHGREEVQSVGLLEFPFPISTPGLDNAPYLSDAHWITRDPETGIRNIGNYRAQIKAANRTGINPSRTKHIYVHWQKYRERGEPMPAALVVGVPPHVAYASVSQVTYGLDEYMAAGGIAGEPVPLVKCKTIDLEVPAYAEIVFEGFINTQWLEPEGAHGEYTGYVGLKQENIFFDIHCITHRKQALVNTILSQFPPSESSKIRQIGREGVYYKYLNRDCNIPGLLDVAFHESGGAAHYVVIKLRKRHQSQVWQALNAASSFGPTVGKVFVAVDDDIDARDPEAVNWAISFRMQPEWDVKVVAGKSGSIDPSAAPRHADRREKDYPGRQGASAVLIDATRKWAYPPVSLPEKSYMLQARQLWERLGLPTLQPKEPWHGYQLGAWSEQDESEARLSVQGDYLTTGAKMAAMRIKSR